MGVIQDIKSFPSRLPACNAEQIYGSPEICLISNHIMERMEEIKSYHPKVFKTCNKSFWSWELIVREFLLNDVFLRDPKPLSILVYSSEEYCEESLSVRNRTSLLRISV